MTSAGTRRPFWHACRDGSEVPDLPKQERRHILADPVAACRERFPQAAEGQLAALRRLHDDYSVLQQQQRDIEDQTRRLSRKIGAAKRNSKPVDALMSEMQTRSAELKTVTARRTQTETEILDYFATRDTATQASPVNNAPNSSRHPTGVAPEQDPDIIQLDDEIDAWNAYVASHPAASIYHRAEWQELIRKTFGHECIYLFARDRNKEIVGVLPLVRLKSRLFGDFIISMPYFNYGGAIADHPLIEQRLMETANAHAARAGCSHIEYRDTIPRAGLPVRSKKVSMLLPLPDSHQALWHCFTSKLRAQIRRPQREQPEVRCGGPEYLDDFYAVFACNMRDLGTPVYAKSFFSNILQAFPLQCTIVSVRLDRKPVAAAFLIGHDGRLEIPWASAIREVNHLSMNMLLYWEALKLGIDRRYREFDFGRSSRDSGTFRFKQQWGAQPQPLYWHYWLRPGSELPELNPDNPKYALAINTWKRLPLCIANRIGPTVVKYLP